MAEFSSIVKIQNLSTSLELIQRLHIPFIDVDKEYINLIFGSVRIESDIKDKNVNTNLWI